MEARIAGVAGRRERRVTFDPGTRTFAWRVPAPAGTTLERIEGPNPTTGQFAVWTRYQPGVTARLAIFDVAGRRVAWVRAPAGKRLVWDGKGTSGSRAAAGGYLYRIEVGTARREGRVVVMR